MNSELHPTKYFKRLEEESVVLKKKCQWLQLPKHNAKSKCNRNLYRNRISNPYLFFSILSKNQMSLLINKTIRLSIIKESISANMVHLRLKRISEILCQKVTSLNSRGKAASLISFAEKKKKTKNQRKIFELFRNFSAHC